MSLPEVSIVILNYNGKDFILDCLESIYQTEDISFEVIIIDNNSKDNSQNICKEKFPEITLIQNEENRGFAVACNQGTNAGEGDFLFYLNPDCIVTPETIPVLHAMIHMRRSTTSKPRRHYLICVSSAITRNVRTPRERNCHRRKLPSRMRKPCTIYPLVSGSARCVTRRMPARITGY